MEYKETVNKAMGMLKAIRLAEAIFGEKKPAAAVLTNQDYY
jgi:anthranilate synthase component 1